MGVISVEQSVGSATKTAELSPVRMIPASSTKPSSSTSAAEMVPAETPLPVRHFSTRPIVIGVGSVGVYSKLPSFENYDEILEPLVGGEFFVTTGEVLLPMVDLDTSTNDEIRVNADVRWTLPLAFAEVVWGKDGKVHRETIPLEETAAFGSETFNWKVRAPDWEWVRVAVWDVAADGAFVNPVRK